MAVKTILAQEDFEAILLEYEMGTLTGFHPIESGSVQTNYRLDTETGKSIFRYYENRTEREVLFEIDLLNHLVNRDYPCPAPYRRKDGGFTGNFHGKPYVLYQFMEGASVAVPSDEQQDELVRRAAALALETKGFTSPYGEYRMNYTPDFCRTQAFKIASELGTPNAMEKYRWYEQEIRRLELPESLPMGACHCDFHFSNMLYLNGKFNALLDFDDANLTYLCYDLICLLEPFAAEFDWDSWNRFSWEDWVFDFSRARQILKEYEKVRPLEQVEFEYLFDVMKLSILVDCLWYFERGGADDFYERRKLYYLDRLGREGFCRELQG